MDKNNPDKRAKELHSLIKNKFSQNFITIAVLTTENEKVIVGSSEPKLREEQLEALQENEIEARDKNPDKHAEEKVIEKCKAMGLLGKEIGTSRPICLDCEDLIKKEGIEPKTALKGEKSKKRKS